MIGSVGRVVGRGAQRARPMPSGVMGALPAAGQTGVGRGVPTSGRMGNPRLSAEADARRAASARRRRHEAAAARKRASTSQRNEARFAQSRKAAAGQSLNTGFMGAIGPGAARHGSKTARRVMSFRKGMALGAGGVVAGAAFSDRSGRPVNKTKYADSRGIYGY